ncbi:MAG TPA: Uma2 family endonuclease [Bryobacteraceae bacterium]|jgi:Uma2 family endonuclease|nr:Uma2 family endonuclease [Bryobacteraceae bacterium]
MSTTTAPMTVDEFLSLPDIEEQRVELIEGEVVDMPTGGPDHERVKSNLNEILVLCLVKHGVGKVFIESGYRLAERSLLAPDISVLNLERINQSGKDLLRGAPDLAIEIVSSETANRLQTKIRLYFKHGAKAVWLIFLETRTIQVSHPDGHTVTLEQDRILENPDGLPGFSTPISAIFDRL